MPTEHRRVTASIMVTIILPFINCFGLAHAEDAALDDERLIVSELILWSALISEREEHIAIPITIVTKNISDKVLLHPPVPHACLLAFYATLVNQDTGEEELESIMRIRGEMLSSEFPTGYSRCLPGKSFVYDGLYLVRKDVFHILKNTSHVSIFHGWDIRDKDGNTLNGAPPKDADGVSENIYAPFEMPANILDAPRSVRD